MGEENNAPEPSAPNLMAWIPAAVRYDRVLPPNAKLLYGEIAALTSAYGYCWARNQYFADLYGFTRKTVSELISILAKQKYITVEVVRANGNGPVELRKIWINAQFCAPATPVPFSGDTSPTKKGQGIPSKVKDEYNKKENIPPVSPKKKNAESAEVLELLAAYAGEDKALLKALMDYDEKRCTVMRSPLGTARSVKLLTNKLDAYSHGDRRVKIALLDEATEKNWKSVFQHDERPSGKKVDDSSEGVPDW